MAQKKQKLFGLIAALIYLAAFLLPGLAYLAEGDLEEACQMEKIEQDCQTLSDSQCRELLEKCDKYFQERSAEIEKDISRTEEEKKTLQNQIYILRNKIKKLDYEIYQNNLMIKDLNFQIGDTEESIYKTSLRIDESKEQLANILREIYSQDQRSTIEILLGEEKLSDFFDNLTALEALNLKGKELLGNIKNLKSYLESQKNSLDEEKGDLETIVKAQALQKEESSRTQQQKDYFLKLTEKEYQKYLAEKEDVERKAAEIRSRIFELIGVPEAPTFGEAYEMAKYVEGITGVRPAFLLAVLTQESNIGKNVGQCFLKDSETGAGVIAYNGKTVSKVMKPSRDVSPFLEITQELGRDPYNTPVSCPMSYGWGGAMGPAQFIPSTWMIYKERLEKTLGRPADPWNIKDAFLAAAVYLSDYGAAKQTYSDEFNAALSYFAGPGWYKSSYKSVYQRDYGYPVMRIADNYEKDITELEKNQ